MNKQEEIREGVAKIIGEIEFPDMDSVEMIDTKTKHIIWHWEPKDVEFVHADAILAYLHSQGVVVMVGVYNGGTPRIEYEPLIEVKDV